MDIWNLKPGSIIVYENPIKSFDAIYWTMYTEPYRSDDGEEFHLYGDEVFMVLNKDDVYRIISPATPENMVEYKVLHKGEVRYFGICSNEIEQFQEQFAVYS